MGVAIIGGGAAGYYAAICCKHFHPEATITIYEKTNKVLSKVKISGGGRCNVTHDCKYPSELLKHYPRGRKALKKHFKLFSNYHIVQWFEKKGVTLKVESDGRMFPISDDSQTIIDTFQKEIQHLGIHVKIKTPVIGLQQKGNKIELEFKEGTEIVDKVIVAIGGSNKESNYSWLADLGHTIELPVPSLFTFNMPGNPISKLMGVTAHLVSVDVVGSNFKASGPLLITHWGMSGPAILKLSSLAARHLYQLNYSFELAVNWSGAMGESAIRELIIEGANKQIKNYNPLNLPQRLWDHLLSKSAIDATTKCSELSKKGKNKLVHTLLYDLYKVSGKTTFKEEFVICGGISWDSVNRETLESKSVDGLYFSGEVLDVDGLTGGFNFQAAWTTAWVAGQLR